MAPPTKCTEELLAQTVSRLRGGNLLADVLRAAGVDDSTARRWRQRAHERPGSIYARWQQEVDQAQAEASILEVGIITRASIESVKTITTHKKTEVLRGPNGRPLLDAHDEPLMAVTEVTEVITEKPPDPKWAAWKLERRNRGWQPRQAIEAQVEHLPPEMLARTMGELLRIAQGDTGPSALLPGDEEAHALIETLDRRQPARQRSR